MHLIVYSSHYSGADIESDLADIVRSAKRNNAKSNITGVLIFDRGRFIQILEGNESDLISLLDRIKNDGRHNDLGILFNTPIKQRELGEWNMDAFTINGDSTLDASILENFRSTYEQNFKLSASQLVGWLKRLLQEPERFAKVFTGQP